LCVCVCCVCDEVSGLKDLVLDAELMKPLDRVAGASLLKVLSLVFIYTHHVFRV